MKLRKYHTEEMSKLREIMLEVRASIFEAQVYKMLSCTPESSSVKHRRETPY
jgi:hypothetical protein